jgi:predicted nucleic acid-binding protein
LKAVVDASAIGPYLLADENRHLLPGLADALAGPGILVPTHWHVEVANLLLIASRRGRLDVASRSQASETISQAIISVDDATAQEALRHSWALAESHRLTIYDAAYLELAMRAELPLATNDKALIKAAVSEDVELFGR